MNIIALKIESGKNFRQKLLTLPFQKVGYYTLKYFSRKNKAYQLKIAKGLTIKVLIILTLIISFVFVGKVTSSTKKILPLKFATGFKIEYLEGGSKLVTDGEGRKLLLVPHSKKIPSGYKNIDQIVEIPVKKIVSCSSTQVALLLPLDVLNSVVGVTTEKQNWYIDEIIKGLEEGRISYLGGNPELNYEKLISLSPDAVFIYSKVGGMERVLRKLSDLELNVAVDNEYLERHPLGRTEWIKFLAAFYNKEEIAEKIFSGIVNRVKKVEKKVAQLKPKPKIIWGNIHQTKIYVPNGDSYVAKLIEMAGGDYIFKDLPGEGSSIISTEEFYRRGVEADIYIYSTTPTYGAGSISQLIEQLKLLRDFKAIKEGKVWCFQPWYWQRMDEIDKQIEDLAAIFHPHFFPKYKLKQFLQLD